MINNCSCCGYEVEVEPASGEYGLGIYEKDTHEQVMLCDICSITRLSDIYTQKASEEQLISWLAKSVGLLFNALIDTLDIREQFVKNLDWNR